jgi:hypothetical protein
VEGWASCQSERMLEILSLEVLSFLYFFSQEFNIPIYLALRPNWLPALLELFPDEFGTVVPVEICVGMVIAEVSSGVKFVSSAPTVRCWGTTPD